MTDFEIQHLKRLAQAIKTAVRMPENKWDKIKIILDGLNHEGDIQLLAEFLSWFEE